MSPQEPPSLGENIIRAIAGFPKYAVEWLLGFYIVLTNTELTGLAVLSVLVGFESGWETGVIVFLAAWLALRNINNFVLPIAQGIHRRAQIEEQRLGIEIERARQRDG